MNGRNRYEVQARLIENRFGIPTRNEVRLACSDTLEDAVRAASTFVADGFTVWVFRVDQGTGITPVYRQVGDVLRPGPRNFRPDGSTSV